MRRHALTVGLALAMAVGTMTPAQAGEGPAELALLAGARGGSANGLNDKGVAVGTSYGTHSRAVRWNEDGTVAVLPLLPNDVESYANAINAAGVIVGDATAGQGRHPVRWNADGTVTALEMPPGARLFATETINDGNVAVGSLYDASFNQRAVRWNADGSATLLGDAGSFATAINNDGVIVGRSGGNPVRWNPDGTVTRLSTAPGSALGISDAGVISGYVLRAGVQDAMRWEADGSATVLTPAAGHTSGTVRGNASGTIFGASGTTGGETRWHAAVWGSDGARLLGDLPGGATSVARWVNADGLAVGWATATDGSTRPVRWAP